MADPTHALSIKQPWAALIAAGRKTVEVRTWSSPRRGPILIHAAKIPDPRPEAWDALDTQEMRTAAEFRGGFVAVAEIVDCILYDSPEAFAADVGRHFNAPAWFRPPQFYGFVFAGIRPLAFRRWPGNTSFFPVAGYTLVEEPARRRPQPESTPVTTIWIEPPEGDRKGFLPP